MTTTNTPDQYYKKYRADKHNGIPRTTPAAPARQKARQLTRQGWGRTTIVQATGISNTHLGELLTRNRRRINATTSQQLLNTTPQHLYAAARPNDLVPAVGAKRRIRALVAIGHPMPQLRKQLGGYDPSTLITRDYTSITKQVWDNINTLYNQLWDTPGPSTRAASNAAKKGWPPPLAWDDDTIEDPTARPTGTTTRRRTP